MWVNEFCQKPNDFCDSSEVVNCWVSNGPVNRGHQSPYCDVKIPRFLTVAITAINTVENAVLNSGGFHKGEQAYFCTSSYFSVLLGTSMYFLVSVFNDKVYRTLMKQKLHTVLHAARRSSVYTVHPDYSVYTLSML